MGEELQRSIHERDSAVEMFLKYCPDALDHLLDRWARASTPRCLMRPIDLDLRGKTFFDFFLFSPDTLKVKKISATHAYLHRREETLKCPS